MKLHVDDAFAELRRLVRFGGVGIVTLLLYSLLCTVLAEKTQLSAIAICIIAYTIGMVVSFVGHRYFTFASNGNISAQIIKFIALHCVCLLLAVLITDLVVDILRWPYGVSILLVDIAIPLASFLTLKFAVFENRSSARPLPQAPDAGT